MSDDEVAADYDSVLEYEDQAAGALGLLRHHILELSNPPTTGTGVRVEPPPIQPTSALPSGENGPQVSAPAALGPRLPKLDLMRFDGSTMKWQSFWDVFRHNVHDNSRLSDIVKFQYLHSLLDGPAAKAIAGILTTENSSADAIEILKERFGNAKIIEAKYLENLRTLTPVSSSTHVTGLRNLYDLVQANIRGLRGLGVPASSYAAMLGEVLTKAIPQDVMVNYHRHRSLKANDDRNLRPTAEEDLEDLLQYFRVEVDCRERTAHGLLEGSSRQYLLPGSGRRQTPPSSAAVLKNSATETCVFCEKCHATSECDSSLDHNEKRRLLMASGSCFRCTTKGHRAQDCRRKTYQFLNYGTTALEGSTLQT
ncbi:uncharacterized protein LOC125943556 [Dermacentor silvarum]|uniref:uncharacterized protein LOC125943556 n=1 Tax=Dermacentor silvarum TaxID=543639 RepID=UPI00210082D4|nr:uncharacterized protein LOC125943556 [Dermacentor silvarum]